MDSSKPAPISSQLILASSSPRRRELLEAAGFTFSIHTSKCDELQGGELSPKEIAIQNARLKCLDVLWEHPADVILAADTVVILDQKLYGNPTD
ncbi:MAG: Maf family protein, partial [Chthoniobacterales bacterium]